MTNEGIDTTIQIALRGGGYTLIDKKDEELVRGLRWYACRCRDRIYARATTNRLFMHRLIAGAETGQEVDHINGDSLDNRASNLRVCTRSQNHHNSKGYRRGKSRFKGVQWWQFGRCWRVQICVNGKQKHIGTFKSEIDAARAYNVAAIEHFGEFARLNEVSR